MTASTSSNSAPEPANTPASLQPSPAEAEAPQHWVERLGATGGTDINLALLDALDMVEPGRPTMVLFLTDGLPTEGEIDTGRILDNVDDAAPDNVRLFAFGVGDDVDTVLLDTLSSEHQGRTTYVRPGEALERSRLKFLLRASPPQFWPTSRSTSRASTSPRFYPSPLPDLFAGIAARRSRHLP